MLYCLIQARRLGLGQFRALRDVPRASVDFGGFQDKVAQKSSHNRSRKDLGDLADWDHDRPRGAVEQMLCVRQTHDRPIRV